MIPRRKPILTASVRSAAPSFAMMCLRWTLTVSSEIDRMAPISRLRLPAGDETQRLDFTRGELVVGDIVGDL